MKQHLGVNKWYHGSILIAKKDFNKGSHAQGWPFHPWGIIVLFPYFFYWLVKTSLLFSIKSLMIDLHISVYHLHKELTDSNCVRGVTLIAWRASIFYCLSHWSHLSLFFFPQTFRVKWSLKRGQNGIYCVMTSWWEHLWKTGTRKVMERAVLTKEVVWNKMTVTEWNWKLFKIMFYRLYFLWIKSQHSVNVQHLENIFLKEKKEKTCTTLECFLLHVKLLFNTASFAILKSWNIFQNMYNFQHISKTFCTVKIVAPAQWKTDFAKVIKSLYISHGKCCISVPAFPNQHCTLKVVSNSQ